MPDDGMTIPQQITLCMYKLTHNVAEWLKHAVETGSQLCVKYLLSVPLDCWSSRQVDIGSCSARPSHWPDTGTVNKLDITTKVKCWTAQWDQCYKFTSEAQKATALFDIQICSLGAINGKVKCTLVQALRLCTGRTAHRGTRRGWGVSVTPRPLFTPGKDPVPIVQEAG